MVTDTIIQRGEFLTSYTPYQAEITQGTLQAIFRISNPDVPVDRPGSRQRLHVRRLDSHDRSGAHGGKIDLPPPCPRRPFRPSGISLSTRNLREEFRAARSKKSPRNPTAPSIRKSCKPLLKDDVAAVLVQSPNFFGVIEPVAQLADAVHTAGALLVVSIAEAVSLGALKPPAEADIVAMEGQSFGLAPSYGGPYVGVIASREKFLRQMPGRLAGQTTDSTGRRGFVLTLATREQHIRREKATSNICTNQALCALAATVHLCLLGKEGLARNGPSKSFQSAVCLI